MENICYNCFNSSLNEVGICTLCGFDGKKNREKYPLALPLGSILYGRYIIGRVLGQGGFGITYLAQDYQTKGLVAIKEFFPDAMATRVERTTVCPLSGERGENFAYGLSSFLDEAKTMAEFIGNPNITRVYSYFEENGTGYFVMEYLEGDSFLDYIKAHGGRISWDETMNVVLPIMDALSAMHAKGIIHRDVTPDNIYITRDGTVKLLDFGAARYSLGNVSRSLDVILKHGFAPKEQYSRHGRQGPYTDVYSLGATIYYAITGVKPDDAIERSDEDNLPMPTTLGAKITTAQEDALLVALAVQPSDRYQNMAAFRTALTSTQQQPKPKPQPQPKPKPAPKPEPFPNPVPQKPLPKWVIPGAAVAAGLCLLLAAKGIFGRDSQPVAAQVTVPPAVSQPEPIAETRVTSPQMDSVQETEAPEIVMTIPATEPPPETTKPMKTYVMQAADELTDIQDTNSGFWGQWTYKRNEVKTITFQSTLSGAPRDAWDVSEAQNGSVLAWMKDGDLYVGADGKIAPNPDASHLFSRFSKVTSIDFGDCFETKDVTDMNHMFYWCESLRYLDVSGFETSKVTDMNSMFAGCTELPNVYVLGFDTSHVTSMWQMFDNCRKLTVLNLSSFDTSRVKEMQYMFHWCFELTDLNLTSFDTKNVESMWGMFESCSKLTNLECTDNRVLAEYKKR